MTAIPEVLHVEVLLPMGFLAVGAMAVLIGEVMLSRARSFLGRPVTEAWIGSVLAVVSMLFLGLTILTSWLAFLDGDVRVFNPSNPMIQLDRFSALVSAIIGFAALLSCGLSVAYLRELRINHGEFYALVLLATCGMLLMVAAVDLLAVFLGLELMSIPIYVLAGFDRRKLRSNESALKYFMIGSFASAILLYGMALLYGSAGSTEFAAIRAAFDLSSPLALIGLGLVVVGFAFKISSVPFHQWTPDVYEGAPAAVTAFMSVTVKTAAFAALLRLFGLGLPVLDGPMTDVLWVLAMLTMIVGNVMAVIQDNVKRLLAYSSIAHAGYILVGVVAGTPEGYTAVVFYLLVYVFMNLGAFGVVVALSHKGRDWERVESFSGMARTRPVLAGVMTLFLISLAGIPGTAGFIGKFAVFAAAVRSGEIWLMIVGVLTSLVSVYYYLRIPVLMYMRDPGEEVPRREMGPFELVVLGVCAGAVVFLGLFPNHGTLWLIGDVSAMDWAQRSVMFLFAS